MSDQEYDVIIVGAGCSGLSAAKSLSGLKIKVLEKYNYIGGRVESKKINNLNVETGALFPILPRSDSDVVKPANCTIEKYSIKYISKDREEISGESILEILENNDSNNSLSKFISQYNVLNKLLDLKIRNPDYGNLDVLNYQQREIVDAVYQITHCGDVLDCLKSIRPITLKNISKPFLSVSNEQRLKHYFGSILHEVELNNNVLKIVSKDSHCEVTTECGGTNELYKSKYVLVSTPPAQIFSSIGNINPGSLEFYSNIPYLPGSVCVLRINGTPPEVDLIINSHEIWSAAFVTRISQKEYILHVYIPHCRRLAIDYRNLNLTDVYKAIQNYLPRAAILEKGLIQHWKYLSPNINKEAIRKYSPEHYKLTPRVWYCGELASFDPSNIYTFGTQAALISGSFVANNLKHEIKKSRSVALVGLFDSELYRITASKPNYIRSRIDGNIAYYGVIASAFKQQNIVNYLIYYQKDYQWEFHENFGATLEDSLLVIEGLINSIGVERTKKYFNINYYINSYFLDDSQLFTTLKNGCSNYWNGPSLVGNAHILYVLKKLQINEHQIDQEKIIKYLYSMRNSSGIWESKWFANNFYTSFYVLRTMVEYKQYSDKILDIVGIISILEQALRQYGSSKNSVLTKVYIIRSLVLLLQTSSIRNYLHTTYRHLLQECIYIMKNISADEINSSRETLLYYWQDIAVDLDDDKLFITSRPKSSLLEAMVSITNDELQSMVV